MRVRNSRVREKVVAVLVSLAALWAFAAWVTVRDGLNLLGATTIDSGVTAPAEPLVADLQRERRLSAMRLASPGRISRKELDDQRARTDESLEAFLESISGNSVQLAASDALKSRLKDTERRLKHLESVRKDVDAGRTDRAGVVSAYNDIIDSFFRVYDAVATLDDEQVAKDGRTLSSMFHALEFLSREDAVVSAAIVAGRFTEREHRQVTELVGLYRFILEQAAAELPEADKKAYEAWQRSPAVLALGTLEDQITNSRQSGRYPFVTEAQWRNAVDPAMQGLEKVILNAGDALVERAAPVAVGVVVRLVLAGLLGLVAVIASVILSITTARHLVRQLETLRTAALELANERLPSVVQRLAMGEKVDVEAEAPRLRYGDDLIGQVGEAFNKVQETAIRTAVEEAELRQGFREILLSLARRTQSLVHRQLSLLDVMERRESDPAELKDLFRIDHLATRMRRNAENLIVLAGSTPARTWRRAVAMVDVVRGALAEVEDYTRVNVLPMGDVALAGRAVGDVIHLLAELIENAVSFSPPYTTVQVSGQLVAAGYAIEVEDRGLGMTPEDLEEANRRLAEAPEFNLSSTARLGLFVVSRLAERHNIQVSLKTSPYGGTTAIVLIPRDLVIDGGELRTPDAEAASREPRPAAVPPEPVPAPRQEEQLAGARRIAVVDAPEEVVSEPAQEVVPVPSAPEPERPTPPAAFTPSGLPFRVPQASLAPALAKDHIFEEVDRDEDERSPEEIRRIMGAFQMGTKRGRSEAAKLIGEGKDDR
ncbi:sensor histidine kinase [Thermobispora bispora]|nr:sensor histidine kinase [Thermobispora bispora]